MGFTPRRRSVQALAAIAAAVALLASLATAGVAIAATSTITQKDCDQGTIRDQSGQPIPKSRCEALIGKPVRLASTGFDLWPLTIVGVACVAGAGVLTLRGRRTVRTV
jgi:hypothetical protein